MVWQTVPYVREDTLSSKLGTNKFAKLVLICVSHAPRRLLVLHAQSGISYKMVNALAVEFHAHNVWHLINACFAKAPITTIMGLAHLVHLFALLAQVLNYAYRATQTLTPLLLDSVPYAAA